MRLLYFSVACVAIVGCSGVSHGAPVVPGAPDSSGAAAIRRQPQPGAPTVPASTYKSLWSFHGSATGPHGAEPDAGLIALGTTLYGTTDYGGTSGNGTVFSLTTAGSESVVSNFAGGSGGVGPEAGLTNVGGTLYGTTNAGGTSLYVDGFYDGTGGTVFKVTPAGTATVLHRFAGAPDDGANPGTSLTDIDGTLYGTTQAGGNSSSGDSFIEGGTVFKITPGGTESVLHNFAIDAGDGVYPSGDLLAVGSTMYGTTCYGGGGNGFGYGTVYAIDTAGRENVVYAFGGGDDGPDGSCPIGTLVKIAGTLYGTTDAGGSDGYGTAFAVTTTGSESILHSFAGGSDGANPQGGLTAIGTTLYGTTQNGGKYGGGTLFSIATSGGERIVHDFGAAGDGIAPLAQLTNVNGTLYGTTYGGGTYGFGTVFAFTP